MALFSRSNQNRIEIERNWYKKIRGWGIRLKRTNIVPLWRLSLGCKCISRIGKQNSTKKLHCSPDYRNTNTFIKLTLPKSAKDVLFFFFYTHSLHLPPLSLRLSTHHPSLVSSSAPEGQSPKQYHKRHFTLIRPSSLLTLQLQIIQGALSGLSLGR